MNKPFGIRWFGKSWGAPVCHEHNHTDTPVGTACGQCDLPINKADQGFITAYLSPGSQIGFIAYHKACFFYKLGIPDKQKWNPEALEKLLTQFKEEDVREMLELWKMAADESQED